MNPKPKVLLSVPNTGWIHKWSAFTLMNIQRDLRVALKIILPTHIPYENNLNHIVKQALDEEFDYWINFDADNPPVRNPIDLVFLDLDVVGCPTPQWHYNSEKSQDRPIYWVAMDKVDGGFKEHPVYKGLQEVDAVGSGCMVVARRVLLSIPQPFMRVYDEYGLVEMGADFNFCLKVKKSGFRIFAHYDYLCRHFKELELLEVSSSEVMRYGG